MSEAANDNRSGDRPDTRRCPICNRPTSDEVRPFCSKRCADVDLHRWLGGRYAIPTEDDPDLDQNPE